MGFCRTNLFKRLESSGTAFIKSIERHILRNYVFIHAIEEAKNIPYAYDSFFNPGGIINNLEEVFKEIEEDENNFKEQFEKVKNIEEQNKKIEKENKKNKQSKI